MARKILYKKLNRIVCTTLVLMIIWTESRAQDSSFELRPGDLLFQDIDCGELCDAIETVTKGIHNADLSHIGIADTLHGEVVVLEAVSAGVKHTALDSFLSRSSDADGNPKVFAGRLTEPYRHLIPQSLENAREKLGSPYDHIYDITDSAYYCSELVYFSFRDKNREPLFRLWPMTFKAPGDTGFFPSWEDYYRSLDHPVPQGKPGLNPGSISLSDKIEIVHIYGYPDGWNKKTKAP